MNEHSTYLCGIHIDSVSEFHIRGNLIEGVHDKIFAAPTHRIQCFHKGNRIRSGPFKYPRAIVEAVVGKGDWADAIEYQFAIIECAMVELIAI